MFGNHRQHPGLLASSPRGSSLHVDWTEAPADVGIYPAVKRVSDLLLSALLLVALSPLLLLCALAVRFSSAGPVLFRQTRVGQRGKPFTFLKFRSMIANADAKPHADFAAAFIQGKAVRQESPKGQVYKLVEDPRITRVGRWLRRTSLDELPQLWNVAQGDMSLVGPRPPIYYELDYYQPLDFQRLMVKPGITGMWQVRGRSATTFEEMVALDLEYIQRRSLGLDLHILLQTIPAVLSGKGAH